MREGSVVPDIDGVGLVAQLLTRDSAQPLRWRSDSHHVLGHTPPCGPLVAAASFLLATKRWTTALLAFLSFHLHLLADPVWGRGPDGSQWPSPCLFPFPDRWQWTWNGEWELNAWPNFVVTGLTLLLTFYLTRTQGGSLLEMASGSADRAFVETLRHRFPSPRYQDQ